MKNFIQPGKSFTVPATADTNSSDPVVMGSLKGIAANTAKAGEDLTINREGVYEVTKDSGAAWSIGDKVYLKDGTTTFSKTATGNVLFGFASEAEVAAATTGKICLADAL